MENNIYCLSKSLRLHVNLDFDKNVKTSVIAKYPSINFVNSENDILYDPEIDVVTIASWDNYHYNQIIKALENWKHIFVEKPYVFTKIMLKHCKTLNKHKTLKLTQPYT